MDALARTMVRFGWGVCAAWIVVVVVSGIAASGLNSLLTNRFVLPGADSEKAGKILEKNFGDKPEGSFSIVVKGAPASGQALIGPARAAAARAAKALKTGKVADLRVVSGDTVSATIVSALQPADAKRDT